MTIGVKPNVSDRQHVAMLASLPAFGQAAALIIRRVDPLWGIFRDSPASKPVWTVYISRGEDECPHCHCDCNADLEEDEIEVAASSEESAKRKAEHIMAADPSKYRGFDIDSVSPPAIVEAPVPEAVEEMFESPEDRKARKEREQRWAEMRAKAETAQ